MAENTNSRPLKPDEVERGFAENLRQAAYVFENEENGRFEGSILACRALAGFIYQRDGGAELAAPFMQIAAAFEELGRGGNGQARSPQCQDHGCRDKQAGRRRSKSRAACKRVAWLGRPAGD
jgi:hypothetical protein